MLETEALIVGAGPAGSAAALTLARAGIETILVDRERFPRDKVCGDGLIPDALRALDRLDLGARIRRLARPLDTVQVFSPDGSVAALGGDLACLPRKLLDDELRQAATRAGARFVSPWALSAIEKTDGEVTGARFLMRETREQMQVRARFTVLATGAAAPPLQIAGACKRKSPSAIAARAYFRNPRLADQIASLIVAYDKVTCPGYGWIFPGPDGLINVGVGCTCDDESTVPDANVRDLFAAFVRSFPLARRVAGESEQVMPLRGAALRMGLRGSSFGLPGLLVAGEAAGATYAFSGEGIGKAMETGMLAAESLARHLRGGLPFAEVHLEYAEGLRRRFSRQFASYSKIQAWAAHPWLLNFLIRRASGGRYVKDRLEAMLAEAEDGSELFSLRGLAKAALG